MWLKKLSIAVIDDGINEGFYNIGRLKHNIEVLHDLTIVKRKKYNIFQPSNGTTCAAIIKKYAEDAKISSIKILNSDTGKAEKAQLIKAIEWCIENNINIINISLGTIDFRDFQEIKICVNKAYKKGIIIIAACNNKNAFTYPACLTNVIGVRCKKSFVNDQYKFITYPFDGIDIIASSKHLLIDIFGHVQYTDYFNSFAAPMVTALVYNMMKVDSNSSLEDIKRKLMEYPIKPINLLYYNPYLSPYTDWVNNAVVINVGIKGYSCNYRFNSFNIVDNIFINLNSKDEIVNFEIIEMELNKIKGNLNKGESIIFLLSNYIKISNQCAMQVVCYFNNLDKNIVFLYEGKLELNKFLKEKIIRVKVWEQGFYNITNCSSMKKNSEIDVPIIYIEDSNEEQQLYVLSELNSLFRTEGYFSVAISDLSKGVGYGMECMPKNAEINQYIYNVYDKYRCDLILIGIQNNAKSYIKTAYLKIKLKEEKITIIDTDEKYHNFKCGDIVTKQDIKKLYSKIIDYFSG